ncbi:MAG: hypothetical protein R6W86_14435 [Marinobacter sp.]
MGPLDKYRAIKVETVAEAMVNEVCSLSSAEPAERVVQIREYMDIVALAG